AVRLVYGDAHRPVDLAQRSLDDAPGRDVAVRVAVVDGHRRRKEPAARVLVDLVSAAPLLTRFTRVVRGVGGDQLARPEVAVVRDDDFVVRLVEVDAVR